MRFAAERCAARQKSKIEGQNGRRPAPGHRMIVIGMSHQAAAQPAAASSVEAGAGSLPRAATAVCRVRLCRWAAARCLMVLPSLAVEPMPAYLYGEARGRASLGALCYGVAPPCYRRPSGIALRDWALFPAQVIFMRA